MSYAWQMFSDIEMLKSDFPGDSVVKNPPANVGDLGLIPASGRSSGEGNGSPLQYSCLGNKRSLVSYSLWGYKRIEQNLFLVTEQQQQSMLNMDEQSPLQNADAGRTKLQSNPSAYTTLDR